MTRLIAPENREALRTWVAGRLAEQKPFRIRGCQTLPEVGRHDVLSTAALNGIEFFEPDDMVIGVGAGMMWQQLNERLATRQMRIPVNPWFVDETVGEVLGANRFGADRMWGGGIRDAVIGLRMVNGKAASVKAGGRVVKNVTGYDLCKLMIGSRGGYGVVTDVTFKTTPAPIAPHGLFGRFPTHHWLGWFREEVIAARLPLDWVAAVFCEGAWSIGLGISGNPPRRARLIASLQKVFDGQLTVAADGEEPARYRSFGARVRTGGFLTPITARYTPPLIHLHGVLPSDFLLTRSRLLEFLTRPEMTLVIHPIGADFHLIGPETALDEDGLDRLRRLMSGSGGYLTLEQAPDHLLETYGYAIPLPSEYPLMQRLKRVLDPAGIFDAPFYEMV